MAYSHPRPAIKCVNSPPPSLKCSFCELILYDPVISVKCGHTFCHICAEEMALKGIKCPQDEIRCSSKMVVSNRAVKMQLDDLQIHCPNGLLLKGAATNQLEVDPSGCQDVFKLSELQDHLRSCQFGLVDCPQGRQACGLVRKKDLEEHLQSCSHFFCMYRNRGCTFIGKKSNVQAHEESCSCKDSQVSHGLQGLVEELQAMKVSNLDMQREMSELARMQAKVEQQAMSITSLNARMELLEGELRQLKCGNASPMVLDHTPVSRRREVSRRSNGTHRLSRESTSNLYPVFEGSSHNSETVWTMPFTLKCIGTFRGHSNTVWSLVSHKERLYSSCSGGEIKVWNINETARICIKTLKMHSTYIMCLSVGNGLLYSADYEGNIRSWMFDSLDAVGVAEKAHDDVITALATGRNYLFSACYGVVKIWDGVTLKEIHSFSDLKHWVRALAYCQHKSCLYAACHKKVYFWKIKENFEMLTTEIDTEHGTIYSLAVSRKHLIVGTQNQNIHIYDVSTYQHITSLSGHISTVTCLLITPCERILFSGSKDSTIQVWSLENYLPIQSLQRHEKSVFSLALYKDNLYSASEDTEIKLYKVFKL